MLPMREVEVDGSRRVWRMDWLTDTLHSKDMVDEGATSVEDMFILATMLVVSRYLVR